MFGRLLPRLQRRGLHKLAWPRPHSPLASLIGQASDAVAAAEAEAAKAAYARRLPPVDEATSFESYLHAVGASEETSEEVRPLSSEEQAEQIRREAAEHRVRRRRGLSGLAGDFIEDERSLELPAGRVDPQEAAGRVVIDRSGQQPTSMWPPPSSSSSSSSSSSLQQQQQQRQQQQQQQQQQRPSNDPFSSACMQVLTTAPAPLPTGTPSNDPFSSAADVTRRTERAESTRRTERSEEAPPLDTRRTERAAVAHMRQAIRNFRLTPRQVKAHLDRCVLADCMLIAC